jgi:hypothetical protein
VLEIQISASKKNPKSTDTHRDKTHKQREFVLACGRPRTTGRFHGPLRRLNGWLGKALVSGMSRDENRPLPVEGRLATSRGVGFRAYSWGAELVWLVVRGVSAYNTAKAAIYCFWKDRKFI